MVARDNIPRRHGQKAEYSSLDFQGSSEKEPPCVEKILLSRLANSLMLGTVRQDYSGVNGSHSFPVAILRLHGHAYESH